MSGLTPSLTTSGGLAAGRSVHWNPRDWIRLDVPLAAMLLALVSFSLPGREAPQSAGGVDPIALAKLAIRMAVIAWFGGIWYWTVLAGVRQAHGKTNWATFLATGQWASPVLIPWMAFVVWSFTTIAWSPLKAVSAGQWLGLAALVVFSQVVALRYQTAEPAGSRRAPSSLQTNRWVVLIRQLSLILGLYSFLVLAVHGAAPQMSGLDRSVSLAGSNGLVHPTAAGATSSLGIVLNIFLLLRGLSRGRWLLYASTLVHLAVLLLSASRAALAVTCLTLAICCLLLVRRQTRGWLMFGSGMVVLLFLIVDPGFELLAGGLSGTAEYVQRGQSIEQLRGVSGRVEMWQAVWDQFEKSPWIGHGYFVTSSDGQLDVWDGPANHDAHHLVLQVLVSTGVVGSVILAWATWRGLRHLLASLLRGVRNGQDQRSRDLSWLLVVFGIWFAGWGQGCVTFLGPIRPESVFFFALLGLLAGAAGTEQRSAGTEHIDKQASWGSP